MDGPNPRTNGESKAIQTKSQDGRKYLQKNQWTKD